MATVFIPTPLRRLTNNQSKVDLPAATVGDLVAVLEQHYPGMQARLLDDEGEVKRFINIFVNDDEIRALRGKETVLSAGDRVSIVPAMAGG